MADFEGTVEAFSQKPKNWAIKIGDKWYSSNKEPKPMKGSVIKGTYETKEWNGRFFFNIKTYEIVSFPPKQDHVSKPMSEFPRNIDTDKIHRQVALKCSVHIISAFITKNNLNLNDAEIMVIELADKLVEYIDHGYRGDFDSESE
jgi:hypothetical protein